MTTSRTILVLGLGASGVAAASLALAEGLSVCAVDVAAEDALRAPAEQLRALGADVVTGCSDLPSVDADLAVVSPGLRLDHPWLEALRARGVPLISELTFGWQRLRGRTLAITGSNGKSTLAKLCRDALAAAGRRVSLGGNYGVPASRLALDRPDDDWFVLEVSSFQLEHAGDFRPDVGVVLNVHPNHLDRHGDFDGYARAKARLFSHMRAEDVGVVSSQAWAILQPWLEGRNPWVVAGSDSGCEVRYADGSVTSADRAISVRDTLFANEVMGETAAAAFAACTACGVDPTHVETAARAFEPLPHRLQLVGEFAGVRYVDDSKATNVAALVAALRVCPKPIRLIAGGVAKERDFSAAKEVLAKKCSGIYLVGNAAGELSRNWRDVVPCVMCGDMEKAVRRARMDAQPGDTVLLSPACASFDQFDGFAERGDQFRKFVNSLASGVLSCGS